MSMPDYDAGCYDDDHRPQIDELDGEGIDAGVTVGKFLGDALDVEPAEGVMRIVHAHSHSRVRVRVEEGEASGTGIV